MGKGIKPLCFKRSVQTQACHNTSSGRHGIRAVFDSAGKLLRCAQIEGKLLNSQTKGRLLLPHLKKNCRLTVWSFALSLISPLYLYVIPVTLKFFPLMALRFNSCLLPPFWKFNSVPVLCWPTVSSVAKLRYHHLIQSYWRWKFKRNCIS